MKLKQSHEEQPMDQDDSGEQSGEEKSNSGLSSPSTSSNSSSFVRTKSKRDRAKLSQPLQAKLDKLVTVFDQLIFRQELSFTVIEKNFGDQLWAGEVIKAENFWECFIGALIRKLGATPDEVFNGADITNANMIDECSYMEIEAGWIWWEIKMKLRAKSAGFRLPSIADFTSYMAKYLDNGDVLGTELENTFLVIAIFIYLYPLSQIRELAQFKNKYILNYLMDQIVDKDSSLQAAIYSLYALQRILEASVLPTNSSNYIDFKNKLTEMATLIPEEESDLDLCQVEDPFRAIQASMLAKITLKRLEELNKLKSGSLPAIRKEHALISLCMRNWFCGTSPGYCNFQMERSILNISKKRYLYFEMMCLTTGSVKIGICNDMSKYMIGDAVESGFDMTTCEYTYSFDGYQKECSRDNIENIPMIVSQIVAGSIIGIRIDTVDKSVTYYFDGEEIKEKRKTKPAAHNRSQRSWESNPYYVTISLAAMQQALILLRREEWLKPPQFAQELQDLYYDHWKFQMAR